MEDGGIPHVVPQVLDEKSYSATGWGDAAVICPWTVYLYYGDTGILEEQYDSMKDWVEYIRNHAENGLIWNSGFHYGDWLALDAKEGSYFGSTPNDFVATAYYSLSVKLLAKTAEILKRKDDACKYNRLHQEIVKAFQGEFITHSGRLVSNTQTAHVLVLMFELAEQKDKKRLIDTLVKLIEENKWHLTTGFLGTPYLCHVLSQNGRNDVAYKLLLQTDYPSWLYPITKGATTIWEHWDGIKPDGSFWSKDMNSFNHYAYGAVGDWMVQVMAGLNADEAAPGYKHIIFRPQLGKGIEHATAGLETMYGPTAISWSIKNSRMSVDVTIPHNSTATLILPYVNDASAIESSLPEKCLPKLEPGEEPETLQINLGSGSYSFAWKQGDGSPASIC